MNSLIHADNIWALWAIIAGCATIAIVLEQKYDWASKVTGAIIALVMMLVLSNVGVIPTSSPVYDAVWDYIVPLALPMLLFTADLKSIKQGAGRLMLIFLLSSLGTIVGGVGLFFASRPDSTIERYCAYVYWNLYWGWSELCGFIDGL